MPRPRADASRDVTADACGRRASRLVQNAARLLAHVRPRPLGAWTVVAPRSKHLALLDDPNHLAAPRTIDDLQAVVERITDGIVALDRDWRYVYLNRKAGELLGRRPADLLGRHIWTEFPEGVGQPFHRAYERAMQTQQPEVLEAYYEPWGRWFENRIYPSPDGISIYFTDVTERKRAEASERAADGRYRLMFEANPQPSWVYDLESLRFLAVNDSAVEHYGYSREEFLAMTIADIRPPEDVPRLLDNVAVIPRGLARSGMWRHRRKDGSLIDVEITSSKLRFDDREARLVMANDVTERLRAEQALRESEARFRHFFDAGLVGMAITVPSKRWGRFNKRLCEMLGYGPEELAGMTWAEVTHPDDLAEDVAHFENVLGGRTDGYAMEKRFIRRDGDVLHAAIAVRAERDAQGQAERFFAIVEDISERRRAEESLRIKEAALDSALSGIALADPQGRLTYVNPALCAMWHVTREQAVGTPAAGYWSDPQLTGQAFAIALSEGRWRGELRARRADGSEFDAQVMASIVRDTGGQPVCVMGSFVDITENRAAREALARSHDELEQLVAERTRELVTARDQAQQANRAKSEFLSRMSHELRTPLNAIIGFGQLLGVGATLDERQRRFIDEILRAGRHLLALINDVLDLAQVEAGRIALAPEVLRLAEVIGECVRMVAPSAARRRIVLRTRGLENATAYADRTRLRQVLLNLMSNAIKYNAEGGSVSIEHEPVDAARVRIVVADTGPGIAPERRSRLFEPFDRLGAESGAIEGSGIGLSIARQLVHLMGGSIDVDSQPGSGSRFWIDLPSASGHVTATAATGAIAPAAPPVSTVMTRTLLYVEDNEVNRLVVQQAIALRRPDIRLLTATTVAAGLESALALRPELLLLDLQLPDGDGYGLLAQLRSDAVALDAPAVAVTAYAMPDDEQRARAAGFADYIVKPIDLQRFEAMLARLLPAAS
jgi:PAS domain S-box-containing protein